ncbi:hypothetical protein [Candidatus Endomicrobiellum agilis]|uniref:hypothetical protein n=1 Tax=Candidatus Endomicrobiellum agilis TaxID=3238957 RepID=UPI00358891B3|nr:hypothetical protein [Endomicrobium sp.]
MARYTTWLPSSEEGFATFGLDLLSEKLPEYYVKLVKRYPTLDKINYALQDISHARLMSGIALAIA